MANFNVVKDYDWCYVPKGSALRNEAPSMHVQGWKLNSRNVWARFKNYLTVLGNQDAKTFYDKLYEDVTPSGDLFLPYFEDSLRSFSNAFDDTYQNGFGESGGVMQKLDDTAKAASGALAQVKSTFGATVSDLGQDLTKGDFKKTMEDFKSLKSDPGTYIETPKMYAYAKTDAGVSVSFTLLNTINEESLAQNTTLIKELTKMNRPKRLNSIGMEPPLIYTITIPGQRFIKWAYCNQFKVSMKGARRVINGVIIPEAYSVEMSFEPLILETSNFLEEEYLQSFTGNGGSGVESNLSNKLNNDTPKIGPPSSPETPTSTTLDLSMGGNTAMA